MSNNVKNELLKYQQTLPKNWRVFHSKKINKVYYYNSETKRTQWEHPSDETAETSDKTENNYKIKKIVNKSKTNASNQESSAKNKNEKINKAKQNSVIKKTQKDVKQTTNKQQSQQKTVKKIQRIKIKTESSPVSASPAKNTKAASINSKISIKTDPSLKGKQQLQLLPQLPPLTKPKTAENCSSFSGSSDRLIAWLQDTSRVNFKDYPVPDNDGQTNSKVILKKGINEQQGGNNILDELLPKHPLTSQKRTGKLRYAPYKTSDVDGKQKTKRKKTRCPDDKNTIPTNDDGKKQTGNACVKSQEKVDECGGTTAGNNVLKINCSSKKLPDSPSTAKNEVNVHSKVSFIDTKLYRNDVLNNKDTDCDEVLAMESEEPVAMSQENVDNVDDMEIDNAEEYSQEIMERLKQVRNNLVVQPQQQSEITVSSNVNYEGTLYIVLDTNVLLSHLKFVVELKDFPIQGVSLPILVIPWVVIQELDNLKDNKWRKHESEKKEERVDMLARIAIKFLNNSFQKSDPRVRGQTVEEASQQVGHLKEESNDDRILQCCLLFQERAEHGNCVLFSNDNNLCNKAIINGIKAFDHQRLIPGLCDLFQCGAIVKQVHYKEYKEQLNVQENLAWRRERADEITCELQIILREGLSYIIEQEMKEAYAELWSHVVAIKPPWTLDDVLQLLVKHWIAVFGHVLKRDQKSLIVNLRKTFDDRKGCPSSLQFTSEALNLGMKLFHAFATHSNYDDAIPKCLAAVNVLIKKCQQYQTDASTNVLQNIQRVNLTQKARIEEVSDENSNVHEQVMDTFNLIWSAVTQFSNQIFAALGYPSSLPLESDQELQTPSKEEAIQFLGILAPRLVNLVNSIKNILQNPWEKSSQDNNLFVQLELSITMFLEQVLSRENHLTPPTLFSFCQDCSMRTALLQGLSQLDRASSMLQHCATCIVGKNL